MTLNNLKAGAAIANITPKESHFLFGYPFVERMSTGVHDSLLSSALYLNDGAEQSLFISNDIIYVSKDSTARIRKGIFDKTGVPITNILIAATHTHSAPVTAEVVISANDPIVPRVDKEYLEFVELSTINAACEAVAKAVSAEIGFVVGDATGVGTNRHNPSGPKDMEVPTMLVSNLNKEYIACMLVCSMHPTILHEDSTLYSSDFPHYVRETLQKDYLGNDCPVIYFTGAAGNQSPRHVTRANTFEEAKRIGEIVANSIKTKLSDKVLYASDLSILITQKFVDLPKREFPSVEWAENHRNTIKGRYEDLKKSSSNPQEIRTAEVNWFGSEELLYLSTLAHSSVVEKAYRSCLPVEIQIIKIGVWSFIAWPGEIFVEYALKLKDKFDHVSLITCANGELQGYIITKEAQEKGFYEAGNSFFDYKSGEILIQETVELLERLNK